VDTLEIKVEVNEEVFSDEIKILQAIASKIERKMRDTVGVSAKIKLVAPKAFTRGGEDFEGDRPAKKMIPAKK